MGNKSLKVILVICSILAILTCFMIFEPLLFEKPNENNTTKIEVTLSQIYDEGTYYTLKTDEYGEILKIRSKKIIVDELAFKNLQSGDKIIVGIENSWLDVVNDSDFVYIVYLSHNDENIITFESNNKLYVQQLLGGQIISAIATCVLLATVCMCAIVLKRRHKNNSMIK